MLDDPAQRIAVRGDENTLAGSEGGRDLRFVVWQRASDRVLEALGVRHLDAAITAIPAHIPGTVRGQRRRGDVVGAAPDLDLFGADLVDHLLLVEPGQPAVMP